MQASGMMFECGWVGGEGTFLVDGLASVGVPVLLFGIACDDPFGLTISDLISIEVNDCKRFFEAWL